MKTLLKITLLTLLMAGLTACQDDMVLCSLIYCAADETTTEDMPAAPEAATEVLADDNVETFEYDGIINRNIQNLLCNSVHHARAGRLDQAAHKLDLAKNDKLPALLDKGRITAEQFASLDNWMADLTILLFDDMQAYASVDQTFPFSCAGVTEESEAIGEAVEDEVDPLTPVDPEGGAGGSGNDFLRMVCYCVFALKDQHYVSAVNYLDSAIQIAKSEYGLNNNSWRDTYYILDGISRLKLRTICDAYRDDYNAL